MSFLPRLFDLITNLRSSAYAAGIETVIPPNGADRSSQEQWLLFQKGRMLKNGIWIPIDMEHHSGIVTNATPSKAPHCIHVDYDGSTGAAACDVAVIVNGNIAWKPSDPGFGQYALLGRLGESEGLVWGGRWKLADLDHFELDDWRSLQLLEESKNVA